MKVHVKLEQLHGGIKRGVAKLPWAARGFVTLLLQWLQWLE